MRARVFSTAAQSAHVPASDLVPRFADVARWSEAACCTTILVYTDNRLVALQPIYMHPYSVAETISSLGCLHGRRVALNMTVGGCGNDLAALHDDPPHDRRYDRLLEYTKTLVALLANGRSGSFEGESCRVASLRLRPPLPPELSPTIPRPCARRVMRFVARVLP